MYHPWRVLGRRPDWTLVWALLPAEILGVTCWATRTITLDRRLSQAERRTTLAHELVHVERGPAVRGHVGWDERQVEMETARRLIGIRELGEALAWSRDPWEVADELWTTPALVRVRLEHLHPAERHYLRRRLEHHDGD